MRPSGSEDALGGRLDKGEVLDNGRTIEAARTTDQRGVDGG